MVLLVEGEPRHELPGQRSRARGGGEEREGEGDGAREPRGPTPRHLSQAARSPSPSLPLQLAVRAPRRAARHSRAPLRSVLWEVPAPLLVPITSHNLQSDNGHMATQCPLASVVGGGLSTVWYRRRPHARFSGWNIAQNKWQSMAKYVAISTTSRIGRNQTRARHVVYNRRRYILR